jgi:hypothetical protein
MFFELVPSQLGTKGFPQAVPPFGYVIGTYDTTHVLRPIAVLLGHL